MTIDRRSDFSQFVAANATRLLRIAYLLTGERAAAEDALQDVLARTYLAWPRIEEPFTHVRAALVHRATRRDLRVASRVQMPVSAFHNPAVADGRVRLEDRAILIAALAELPPRRRAIIVLRFLEGLTEAETAATLRCSIGTVRTQTSRALAALHAVLADHDRLAASRRAQ